ncbi:N-acetyl-alpha-D-glucosaminyl L-malate synthase BshA [Paenibacillus taichungensis]|uniref:N-acetyl-alpha-D-glucosaminyl L-malate synthase BshA n=2 Tax=Paenibacillus taichungensis TaxID=484184 RepID=A0ABX2MS86_9BACL|nr:N-acetyl-alpha-D-glucosaminyl L-malate synthase BshA [Paenibacillus taichungensis]
MVTPLKIGIVCHPTLGGSGILATELGKLLAEKGHEIHMISFGLPFRLNQPYNHLFYHKVEVSNYYVFRSPPYEIALASKIAQVAIEHRLDLVHVHYAYPHAISAFLAKQILGGNLRVVTTLHGTDITVLARSEINKDLIRLALNSSDAITAVSKDLINETSELLHISQDKINLIYNFVDQRIFYPQSLNGLRKEFADTREKILIHVSNFRPIKRVTDVLGIFKKVNEEVPSRLLLVGEGPELSNIQNRVQIEGLESRVNFLGKIENIARIISIADLLLLPSEMESFGLTALEAMSCGVPTIGSHIGGLPELIINGETGYLASVGNISEMAKKAIELLVDKKKYNEFKNACVNRAHLKFSTDRILAEYEYIYYIVIGK